MKKMGKKRKGIMKQEVMKKKNTTMKKNPM